VTRDRNPPETSPVNRVLAGLALAFLTAAAAPPKLDPARYGWYADYASATAEARRTGKPIFLVFRCEP
jgi:hypothetical protein